jgi:probable addiction module antidote protein
MAIKLKSYRSRLLKALADPSEALHYLNAALKDSPEMFLEAIKDVAQAHQMSKVAKKSGVAREALYRSLSKKGNPTFDTLNSVLRVVGVKFSELQLLKDAMATPSAQSPSSTANLRHRRPKAIRVSTSKHPVNPFQNLPGLNAACGSAMAPTPGVLFHQCNPIDNSTNFFHLNVIQTKAPFENEELNISTAMLLARDYGLRQDSAANLKISN